MDIEPNIFKVERRDFVEDLTQELKFLFKGVNPLWAEACARTTLSTGLFDVRVPYGGSLLKLNQFIICIGPPGVKKTLPLRFCQEIISQLNFLTKKDYSLVEKFSVAGMIDHLCEIRKGSEKSYPPVYKYEGGTIFRDEFTALFKQARKVDWALDMLEFLSELYDGYPIKKRTKEYGLQKTPSPYVNLLTTTTYDFISKVDDDFFTQGTGTRFLYSVIEPDDITVESLGSKLFSKGASKERAEIIDKYAGWLRDIYKVTDLKEVALNLNARILWDSYYMKIETEWLDKTKQDPLSWEYPYLNRLPEYVLKLAGIYSISRQNDYLVRLQESNKVDKLKDISIDVVDVEKAIQTINKHRDAFEKLVRIRKTITGRLMPKSHQNYIDTIVEVLRKFPKGMATGRQWFNAQTVTANEKTFIKYKETALQRQIVKVINRQNVSDEDAERLMLKPNSKVYRVSI